MVLFRLLYAAHALVEYGVRYVLGIIIYVALFLAVAYKLTWIDRWIWYCIETEASKIMNGAKVTVGSFDIDWSGIFEGKILAHGSNIVVHTPQKEEWGWEAPLIARVGKATVEANLPITLFNFLLLRREIPIEAYTVVASDIQCFIERRDSVINVYLLNQALKLPPPPFQVTDSDPEVDVSADPSSSNGTNANIKPTSTNTCLKNEEQANAMEELKDVAARTADTHTGKRPADEQAKLLVNEMLTSIQDLGRAAKRGQLPGAIKQQGLELVDRLKGLKDQDAGNLEEGLKVIQQFGKVAVESLQSAPQRILPQPDSNRKKGKIVLARVGRIVVTDMRIFTKDSWIKSSASTTRLDGSQYGSDFVKNSGQATPRRLDSTPKIGKGTTNGNSVKVSDEILTESDDGGWNKPIFIERVSNFVATNRMRFIFFVFSMVERCKDEHCCLYDKH